MVELDAGSVNIIVCILQIKPSLQLVVIDCKCGTIPFPFYLDLSGLTVFGVFILQTDAKMFSKKTYRIDWLI